MNKLEQTKKPGPKKIGAPARFDAETRLTICERIADGQSLRTICADPDMPSMTLVFRWLQNEPEFVELYARAKEQQADALFEDVLAIADDASKDNLVPEAIARARIQIDARKWMAGKLRPKVYGDKIDINANVTHVLSALTDEELAAEIEKTKAGQP